MEAPSSPDLAPYPFPDDRSTEGLWLDSPASSQTRSSQLHRLAQNRIRSQLTRPESSINNPFIHASTFAASQEVRSADSQSLPPLPPLEWNGAHDDALLSSTLLRQVSGSYLARVPIRVHVTDELQYLPLFYDRHHSTNIKPSSARTNSPAPSSTSSALLGINASGTRLGSSLHQAIELSSAATLVSIASSSPTRGISKNNGNVPPSSSNVQSSDATSVHSSDSNSSIGSPKLPVKDSVDANSSSVSPTSPVKIPTGSTSRNWSLRAELHNTQAHFYLGPLSPDRVLSLLASTSISKHARSALTGTPGGYLKYLHFLGMSSTPSSRHRPGKSAATPESQGVATREVREWWQCRACHVDLHNPPDQISNLGAHLYGTKKPPRPGCLELRAKDPVECIPPPERDASGNIIRICPGRPISAARAPKRARTEKR
ncbi:hypothetical protein CF319_g4339 [Tilletia indica]|nr:hypothetical protein CF319_g4339 [Tilletia indica]